MSNVNGMHKRKNRDKQLHFLIDKKSDTNQYKFGRDLT